MSSAATKPSPYLTIKEAAAYIKLRPSTLYQYASKGRIPSRKHFGKRVFVAAELDAWSDDQTKPTHDATPFQSRFESAKERIRSLKIHNIAPMPKPLKGA